MMDSSCRIPVHKFIETTSNTIEELYETSDSYVTTDEEVFSSEAEDTQDFTVQKLSMFADKITRDLCHYIRFNSAGEDHCDVYEDKFASTVSGRDLYYADLLAMARYGDNADCSRTLNKRQEKRVECKWPCSGRRNPKLGLGPLSELFDHVYRTPKTHASRYSRVPEETHCLFSERSGSTSDFNYPYLEYNLANQLDLSEILEKWPMENSHQNEQYTFHSDFTAGQ